MLIEPPLSSSVFGLITHLQSTPLQPGDLSTHKHHMEHCFVVRIKGKTKKRSISYVSSKEKMGMRGCPPSCFHQSDWSCRSQLSMPVWRFLLVDFLLLNTLSSETACCIIKVLYFICWNLHLHRANHSLVLKTLSRQYLLSVCVCTGSFSDPLVTQ